MACPSVSPAATASRSHVDRFADSLTTMRSSASNPPRNDAGESVIAPAKRSASANATATATAKKQDDCMQECPKNISWVPSACVSLHHDSLNSSKNRLQFPSTQVYVGSRFELPVPVGALTGAKLSAFGGLLGTDAPNHFAHVVGHQQSAACVYRHAHRPAVGLSLGA